MPHDRRPVFRFAPSPNGELHLGHAYSALFTSAAARAAGGRFLLRIEDIDPTRCRPEFEAWIYEDLAWLGLDWERPPRRQSDHFSDYRAALSRLEAMSLVYPCFASRKQIAAAAARSPAVADPDGAPVYPGLFRDAPASETEARKAAGEPYSLRLHVKRALLAAQEKTRGRDLTFREIGDDGRETLHAADPERWGDVILARKETPASYHLAVVVDDALQGVTHVSRGRDLFAATGLHRLLQVLLDLPEPLYQHHRLVADAQGRKLSKSWKDTSLRSLRAAGRTPGDVITLAGAGDLAPSSGEPS
jgi:glutamyl-Q tRNA(Asp) synthetase